MNSIKNHDACFTEVESMPQPIWFQEYDWKPNKYPGIRFDRRLFTSDSKFILNRNALWREEFASRNESCIPKIVIMDTIQYSDPRIERHFIHRIERDNKILEINRGVQIEVEITLEDKQFVAYNSFFGIYGFGETKEKAIGDFESLFMDYYIDLIESPIEELGPSSIKIRKLLSAFATLNRNE